MNESVICENCGATCAYTDAYCRKCSQPLVSAREASRPVIAGIDNEQLKTFVDKNADYYAEKFIKSRGKKVFLQINWSALLLGTTWAFYRKMYKAAIWYMVILLAFSWVLSISLPLLFSADIDNFYECKAAYEAFYDSDEESHFFYKDENGVTQMEINPVYEEICDNLSAAQVKIRWLYFGVTVPPVLLGLILRLFANCMYKQHVRQNIDTAKGGTSLKSAIFGQLSLNIGISVASWIILMILTLVAGSDSVATIERLDDAYTLLYQHL